jgi:hypothetical protein
LVFDRTQADVNYANNCISSGVHSEQNLKGAYNICDRNRAAEAAKYIAGCLRSAGINEAAVHIKDDWNALDIVRHENNEEILTALRYLKYMLPEVQTPPVPADLTSLTYIKANDIERILFDLGGLFERLLESLMHFGDAFASGFDPFNWQGWDN